MAEIVAKNSPIPIGKWIQYTRPPLHSVGIAPMLVGTVWAATVAGAQVDWILAILGILAVMAAIVATHYTGEYFDRKEDALSYELGKSPFAGGAGLAGDGYREIKPVLYGGIAAFFVAAALGLIIQFVFKTGPWTIPLGAFGVLSGFFYSTPPIRLAKRGFGELFIGICYGFLPIFISNYLQTGEFDPRLALVSTPVAISIFLVILINEFPDYPADKKTGKKNITVRLGKRGSSFIYVAGQLVIIASLVWIYFSEMFSAAYWLAIPALIAAVLAFAVGAKKYEDAKSLEGICGFTIILNLSTSLILILLMVFGS